jgi:hypothetical protein
VEASSAHVIVKGDKDVARCAEVQDVPSAQQKILLLFIFEK